MKEYIEDYEANETLCQLEDGSIVPYDACHSNADNVYDPAVFEFIGIGRIYSIDGVEQNYSADTKEYFYRRIAG